MHKAAAQELVQGTLQGSFNKERFVYLIKNILNHVEEASFTYKGSFIFDDFADSIKTVERVGKYETPDGKLVDILVVYLQKDTSLERARTKQRNFVAKYLKGSRGGVLKDAALVAFVAPNGTDWRFSLVKMEYRFNEQGKVKEEFTPARRYSFLVGANENSHTAQSRLLPPLLNDESNPTLEELEEIFSVERVTKEFFEKYRDLFLRLKDSLDAIVKKDAGVRADFKAKHIHIVDFAKKLLGQIVFLYFLQRKGWFGVERGKEWGSGPKRFLRELFEKKHGDYTNFFNDILEPLFYEALRLERPGDYYSRFNCRIPFLNGGLFDPLGDYDWWNTDILLPEDIFSNHRRTKEGDIGDGILDIFDRYNFTVKEDEPLEKEVAVDPEMLGKVFENLLEVKDRKSKGTYYTPREIVHYMCQESLANYLATELTGRVSKEDVNTLIRYGEMVVEHDSRVMNEGRETKTYAFKLPEHVRKHAKLIDEKLASIRVCDPAVGSGAFPVGMMNEVVRTRNALTPYLNGDKERSPYHFKRHAIQNCLYGVDIDAGAVEIAKLRLWLSLVVDEEERETIQPLPNLDYKIVQGDSLLRVQKNLFNAELFSDLEELKPLYFNETSASKKQKYKEQIESLIGELTNGHEEFDFEVYFSEVFHEKKGFDVAIANPPYLSALEFAKIYGSEKRHALNKLFHSAKGTYDLYILFIEKSITLLNPNGKLAFINPNKYLSAKYGEALRRFILENARLDCLVDVSGIKIFHEVSVYPVLSFMSRNGGSSYRVKLVLPKTRQAMRFELSNYVVNTIESKLLSVLPENIWGFLLSDKIDLLLKLMEGTVPLAKLGDINASTTASEADQFSKWISGQEGHNSLKVLNTGLVDRYLCLWGDSPMKVKGGKLLTPYLSLDAVNARRSSMYKQPKIIYAKLARRCEAFLDVRGEYAALNTNVFYNPSGEVSLNYVAAYSNSQLFMFFYDQFFGALRMSGGFYQFQAPQLRVIPIRTTDDETSKKINVVVDRILAVTRDNDYLENASKQARMRKYERQVDELIYQAYGLTDEEIKIVEEQSNQS